MKKILKIVENIILIIIIILLCIYAGLRFFKKVEIYKVETGSMEENIHRGDYLLIVKQNSYKVGDVVTFQINGNFITHRIIKKEGKRIVTKGDANNTEDDEINESQIIGKLMYKSKLFNFIIDFKFFIISLFIAGYLVTCYFDDKNKVSSDEEVKA
ncbi:MAG: signal peptidase I [Bacilli bacterium]|nr:signal peptidase I [Bacilli bacterium]